MDKVPTANQIAIANNVDERALLRDIEPLESRRLSRTDITILGRDRMGVAGSPPRRPTRRLSTDIEWQTGALLDMSKILELEETPSSPSSVLEVTPPRRPIRRLSTEWQEGALLDASTMLLELESDLTDSPSSPLEPPSPIYETPKKTLEAEVKAKKVKAKLDALKEAMSPKAQQQAGECLSPVPCSSVYYSFSDPKSDDSPMTLNEDNIRAFLNDYCSDYDTLKDMQFLDTIWHCFAEQYYDPEKFQSMAPSGNPIGYEELVLGLILDTKILSVQMVSIDSITILESKVAAIVVFTCDHSFKFRGVVSEERSVMTCVLELDQVKGAIKIVHEHRSFRRPIPKETSRQEPEEELERN